MPPDLLKHVDRLFAVEDRQAWPLLRVPDGHERAENPPFADPVPYLPRRHQGLLVVRPGVIELPQRRIDLTTTDEGEVSSLTVTGRGYGHGIGMCQWGAIGRARAGQDFRTILETYYPGTRVGPIAA